MRSKGKQIGRVKRLTAAREAAYPWSVFEREEESVMKVQIRISLRLDAPTR